MKAIKLLNTDMPQSVPCANCGQQAHFEDYDFDGDSDIGDNGVHVLMYHCESDECAWWTDWEISIENGEVKSSSLYFLEDAEADSIHWHEMRDLPHFWVPDGLEVPERS